MKGVLPVKLIGTSSRDTSRQQFGVDRSPSGVFTITNYSKTPIQVEGQSGGRDLDPNMQRVIAENIFGMQRAKISWGNGRFEVSVNGIGSGKNDWVNFVWKVK